MSGGTVDLNKLLREASHCASPTGPARLLATLSEMPDPFHCVDEDERERVSAAQQADFDAIYRYRWSGIHLEDLDRLIWIDRLAWFLQAMDALKEVRPDIPTLLAMLRTAVAFSYDEPIWNVLPKDNFSANLIACMSGLVGSTKCTFSARGQRESIWEREVVNGFLTADANGDWPAIENSWRTIISAITPDGDLYQAVTCLNATELGQQALAMALDKAGAVLPVALAANPMTSSQKTAVARHSASNRTRFVLIQSLAFDAPRTQPLEPEATSDLTAVFRVVQESEEEWRKWMKALNRRPVHATPLQLALGAALVDTSAVTKTSYVDAIELNTAHGECREAVSACLASFRKVAHEEESKSMWCIAHERWTNWDFDKADALTPLTTIAVSDLDYAIIGYITECLTEDDLQIELQTASVALTDVQDEWYDDRTAHDAAWYRALSRWQIINYANGVRNGLSPWEWPKQMPMPLELRTDRYAALTLKTRMPHGLSAR